MNDVGLKIYKRYNLKNRAGEERESLRVVIMTVNSLTLEIILIVKEIIYDAVSAKLENTAVLTSPRYGDGDMSYKLHLILILLLNTVVQRHYDSASDKTLSQSLRKTSGNVSETARSQKRLTFADCIQYFHFIHSPCCYSLKIRPQAQGTPASLSTRGRNI